MRISLVCRTFLPAIGGLETVVAGLARALAARNHRVRVVTLREPGREAEDSCLGVEVVRLVRLGPKRYPSAVGLRAAVADSDVVHVHGIDGLLDTLVWGKTAAPIVVSTHGGYFHTARTRHLKALWLRTATRATLSRCARVWFTSAADRDTFAPAHVEGDLVENGLDLGGLLTSTPAPVPGRFVVLGRIAQHKGVDALLLALSRRKDRVWTLTVVGPEAESGQISALTAQAQALGLGDRVTFPGPGCAPAVLAGAACVVAPSRYEGFGLVAVEAMAAGVPVVLADIPAFRRHADVACLVDFTDPEASAAALFAPVDPARVAAARAHAATFDWTEQVRAFEDGYKRLRTGTPMVGLG